MRQKFPAVNEGAKLSRDVNKPNIFFKAFQKEISSSFLDKSEIFLNTREINFHVI